jgi:hypothetical protein
MSIKSWEMREEPQQLIGLRRTSCSEISVKALVLSAPVAKTSAPCRLILNNHSFSITRHVNRTVRSQNNPISDKAIESTIL